MLGTLQKRGLAPEELREVHAALRDAGIVPEHEELSRAGQGPRVRAHRSAFRVGQLMQAEEKALSGNDEQVLARRVQAGLAAQQHSDAGADDTLRKQITLGRAAEEQLVLSNVRLVAQVARRYATAKTLSEEDLFQSGALGLLTAVRRFDPELGYRFSTYATWWIRQATMRALANLGRAIRLPVYQVDALRVMRRIERRLSTELRRRPTDDEVAEQLGWPAEKVTVLREASGEMLSTDTGIAQQNDDGGDHEGVQLPSLRQSPEEEVIVRLLRDAIGEAFETLTEREQRVLVRRFGLDAEPEETLEEIGETFGVTRERIRQLESMALDKLKRPSRSKRLREFAEEAVDRNPHAVTILSTGADGTESSSTKQASFVDAKGNTPPGPSAPTHNQDDLSNNA